MAITVSNTTSGVATKVVAYKNGDDVGLFWRVAIGGAVDQAVPDGRGFMIQRQRRLKSGEWGKIETLRNRVGFSATPAIAEQPLQATPTQPSNIWPFQCFDWTDHGANSGETVRYRVSAVKLPAGGTLGETELTVVADSGWTQAIGMTADCGAGMSAFFNRGAVMSQYVARYARLKKWGPRDIKDHIKELQEPLRRFLSGDLRVALLDILDRAIENPLLEIYAALYELSDKELIDRLKLLRARAHIVLANGSDKQGDGNADARAALKQSGVDVRDRLLGSKGLGHNKFLVVQDTARNEAISAWTGSTNWAATGLCTQLNNGILIENQLVAKIYLDQWQRLSDAGGSFPASLVAANAASPKTAGPAQVWFSRVRNKSTKNTGLGIDLEELVRLVKSAREKILYVMFQPGSDPLQDILSRAGEIYVRGVVSTVTARNREKFALSGLDGKTYHTALVQPEGIGKGFSWWVKEVTRSEFLFPNASPGIGHAITHAKMIVIDPLDDDCKVITGSHNFSISASEQNDENFVVIEGNRDLAEAYSVACLATYRHYRWRAYVKDMFDKGEKPWDALSKSLAWQDNYLTVPRKAHLDAWCKFA